MWRTRIIIIGFVVFVIALAGLSLNTVGATAAPLLQIPPTNTPLPPTDTPLPPTNTPIGPTNTPIPNTPLPSATPGGPTPPSGTATAIPPTRQPHPGGGGVPPGPSGTPTVGGCVKSVGKNGISLSTEPGFYQPHVQIVPRDHLAQVLAGPQRTDNIWWWLLQAETGAQGWGNQDDMTPDPGPCAFGASVLPGVQTPPYPVTIIPAADLQLTSVAAQSGVQAVPLAAPPEASAPTVQATPAQPALPQTGNGLEWWGLAGLLTITVIVVGFVRRRLQAQPAAGNQSSVDDEETKE